MARVTRVGAKWDKEQTTAKQKRKKKYTINLLAIDTETTGLDLHHGCLPYMVTTCDDTGVMRWWEWSVDIHTRTPRIPHKDKLEIQALMAKTRRFVFHNAKFDVRALQRVGIIKDPEVTLERSEDTSLAAHVIRSDGPLNLKDLSLYYCQIPDTDKDELKESTRQARALARSLNYPVATSDTEGLPSSKGSDLEMMDGWLPKALVEAGHIEDEATAFLWKTVCALYGKRDAERTIALWHSLYGQLRTQHLTNAYRIRQRLLIPTYRMEETGMNLIEKRLQALYTNLLEVTSDQKTFLNTKGIHNPNSTKQIRGIIYECHHIQPPRYTAKGLPSTDAETLETISQENPDCTSSKICQSLLKYRKQKTTLQYLDSYLRYAIPKYKSLSLHPGYKIPGTKTTRYSSQNPNGQNIEKKGKSGSGVRSIFGPRSSKVWLSIDYSNIELRIFAYGCKDKALIEAYQQGQSVHLVICKTLYPDEYDECRLSGEDFAEKYKGTLYQWVKNGNFALIYGASPDKADKTYHLPGAYNLIRKRLPKIDSFIQEKHKLVKQSGYITTLGGYRLWVPQSEPHKAVNYYCQGSAGDAMSLALVNLHPYVKSLRGSLIASIHDEVLIELPKPKFTVQRNSIIPNLKNLMESVGEDLGLPLPVDCELITESWAQGKPV